MIIIPTLLISIIACINRYITKSWLSPGSFFSLCWSFFLILPIIFAPDYNINQLGIWFIVIFSMGLATGSIVSFYSNSNNENNNLKKSLILTDYSPLIKFFIIFNTISFLGIYFLFNYASNTYSVSYYSNSWLNIPNMISVDRYDGVLNYPFFIKYSLYFIFPSNLLGGVLFGLKHPSNLLKIYLTIPLMGSLMLSIIEGARTSILLGLILFFSAWLSVKTFNSDTKNSVIKTVISSGAILLLFTFSFIFIQWLRQGMDIIIIDLLAEKIRAYFFGYLSAFTQWVSLSENNLSLGFVTFAGPYNLFGIIDRPLGFYEPIFVSDAISTNIYTAFRGLITDFSISGAIIFAFIIGYVTQFFFQKKDNFNLIRTLPISLFYAFTLYSPLISIFHYNSILFSWIILLITMKLNKNEAMANYS